MYEQDPMLEGVNCDFWLRFGARWVCLPLLSGAVEVWQANPARP